MQQMPQVLREQQAQLEERVRQLEQLVQLEQFVNCYKKYLVVLQV